MLDVDNPAADQAPSPSRGTPRRAGGRRAPGLFATPGPQRPVLLGGIAAAVVLGLLIGFLTAPSGHSTAKKPTAARPSGAAAVNPLAPKVSDFGRRGANSAHFVTLDTPNRTALLKVFYRAYGQGRSGLTQPGLAMDRMTIPAGVAYGVVEGPSAATDTFYAVASIALDGQTVGGKREWKRSGSAAWTYLGAGCAQVPASLLHALEVPGC